jgi:hypothetical protein
MTETIQKPPQWIAPSPYYENHPWFFGSWKRRHERHKNLLICATGQSLGIGKTYWMLSAFEKMYPDFTVDQVVFIPKQFWDILESLPRGEWAGILWDDPTKGLQKRDWYKEVNKAVTSFAKTASRYRQRDLGFALPSFDDLDIALREIMVLEAQMKEPGLAKIHRIKRNKFGNPPFWKPYQGEVQLPYPKLAVEYEKRREEFHKEEYKGEQFREKGEETLEQVFDRVLREVKSNPVKFSLPDKHDNTKLVLNARLICSLVEPTCSDAIARRVITRIEYDKRVQPL